MKLSTKSIVGYVKQQNILSNFWVRTGVILLVLAILTNHLFEPKTFPSDSDYEFPFFPIAISVVSGVVVILIARYNFYYFKNTYFVENINMKLLIRFLFSTLGYITLFYVFLYLGLNGLINGIESYSLYNLLKGLSLSLLICTLGIALLFSIDIYKLHKHLAIKGMLKVQRGGKITLVAYPEIAYIYSENRIVYIIKTDGTKIITEFTLNDIERKISDWSFFRVNRQTILHIGAIEQVRSIENGKLAVQLKHQVSNKEVFQITISRYKKQAFKDWFEGKV